MRGSIKKGVLRSLANFTAKHLCQGLFFNKVAGIRPPTLLKKRLWHNCFPANLAKFISNTFSKEHLWWLLLNNIVLSACFMKNLSLWIRWTIFLVNSSPSILITTDSIIIMFLTASKILNLVYEIIFWYRWNYCTSFTFHNSFCFEVRFLSPVNIY